MTGGHLRDLEACSLRCYASPDPLQKEMPMPAKTICISWRTGRLPIKRRAVVSTKKVVMVNTDDWLFAEVEESLTILESPYPSSLSNSFSSLGTDQGVQGLMALLKAALQTQARRNEGGKNEGGEYEGGENEGRKNEDR